MRCIISHLWKQVKQQATPNFSHDFYFGEVIDKFLEDLVEKNGNRAFHIEGVNLIHLETWPSVHAVIFSAKQSSNSR